MPVFTLQSTHRLVKSVPSYLSFLCLHFLVCSISDKKSFYLNFYKKFHTKWLLFKFYLLYMIDKQVNLYISSIKMTD